MALPYKFFHGLAAQMPEIPAGSIVSRLIFSNRQIEVTLFGFAPGQQLADLAPVSPAVLEVWRGDGHITLGSVPLQDVHEISPGTWLYLERGTPHTIQARSALVVLLTLYRESTAWPLR